MLCRNCSPFSRKGLFYLSGKVYNRFTIELLSLHSRAVGEEMISLKDDGYLEAGIHDYSLDMVESQFVIEFPHSKRRRQIFDNLLKFTSKLKSLVGVKEIWIDGSFCSDKVEPNDVDIVCFLDNADIHVPPEQFDHELHELHRKGQSMSVDSYYAVYIADNPQPNIKDINKRNYWRGQFGFDRSDTPKGILSVKKIEG